MNQMFAVVRQLSLWLLLSTVLGLAACGGGDGGGGGDTGRKLSRIEVTPSAPSIAAGTQKQFTATAVYSDNTREDATTMVTWASSNATAATITPTGLATGRQTGSSTIAATLGGVTGATTLTVTAAAIRSLAVTPSTASIAKGTTQAFKATATFTDNSTQDVTAQADWSSSNTAVATVGNSGAGKGVATGVATGSANINATYAGQGGSASLTVTAATLSSVSVTPKTASAAKGTMRQYSATAIYSDNSTVDVTTSTTWTSSDSSKVSISDAAGSKGLATAQGIGSATLTGSYMGSSDTATLSVTAAQLVSIAVTSASASAAKGQTDQFTATGTYTDGSTQNLTMSVTWTSSDTNVATISNASGSNGLATATNLGTATISAAQPGSSISGSASLTVTAAVVTAVGVTPAAPSVPNGLTQQFTATATFSDSTTQDVTTSATWTSSDTSIATISNADGSHGLAQTLATGSTVINGSYMGYASNATLTVTAATLSSIAVTPGQPSIPNGLTQQFTATGTYSDGSTQDVSTSVAWASSDTSIATISNASGSQGLAQGKGVGSTTITASSASISGAATLTVTSAVIQSVSLTPSTASIANGTTQQFTATASFSDGSTQDVTGATSWSSSDTTVATISNASGSAGLATGVAVGSVTITGAYSGVSNTATLTVTSAVLQSISVTPPAPSIANGLTQQFTATGVYTDNSTQDITTAVTWSSSSTSVATISNASGSQGLAQALATGTTTITATQSGGSISGTATLTVTAATLSRIDVTPTAASVPRGTSQQYTATAVFSDNSTQDFTGSVTWTSSNTAVATISNASGSKGLLQGVNQGNVTVTATDAASGTAGSTTATVSSAVLRTIGVTPANSKVAPGFSLQYTATGTYSDNTTQDITTSVTWTTDNTAFATISNASGSQGLATAKAAGGGSAVAITATLGSVSSSTNLTITSATLTSIAVTPASASLGKGQTQQYTATGTFTDNSTSPATTYTQDLTTQASWTSSNTAIATISDSKGSKGLATVVATSGTTTIAATAGGKSGSTTLTATAAVLVSIDMSPLNASIAKGRTLQFMATGTYSDGSMKTITTDSTTTWSASSSNVATISNAGSTKGLATAVGVGSVTIYVTVSGVQQSTTLTVTAAVLQAISVTPKTASVTAGLTQQYAATGTYSDNSTATITTSVTWATSDTSIATISNASGSKGLATTAKMGSVNISATDPATGISNADNTATVATLTVTAATLNSITVAPKTSMVSTGQTTQLTVTGNYSDGSTPDLTTQATWTSSNTAVATVGAMTGVVSGVTPGSATITATFGGKTDTSALTVVKAPLQSIKVSAPSDGNYSNPSQVPASYSLQYRAIGTYQDGSTADLTASVTWSTANASVATVSNASATKGVVTGVAAGSTSVSATMGTLTSNNANVTVTTATLTSIDVSPKNQTTSRNATLQFLAEATFSDGSMINITINNGVTWASSNTQVATIGAATGITTGGTLAGSMVTSTNITATKGTIVGTTTLN